MRNPNTLFIVGAGASCEADLPNGKKLIDIIASKLNYQLANGSRRQGHGGDDILDIFQQETRTREGSNHIFKPRGGFAMASFIRNPSIASWIFIALTQRCSYAAN
jgi:hypothetical protein